MTYQQQPPQVPQNRPFAVPIWMLLLVASFFVILCSSVWAYTLASRTTVAEVPTPTVVVVVETVENVVTPVPSPTAFVIEEPTEGPTPTLPPPPTTGSIVIGELVKVTNTDGDGLRFRSGPGLNTETIYLAIDNEVFFVQEGPIEADGFNWWKLTAQADETREGWAVENFLEALR